eukprot:7391912-Alexandrium_andersonii.AAC.1
MPVPVTAAIRLNPRSAIRNTQNRFKRSGLEVRRPRNGPTNGPRSSGAVHFSGSGRFRICQRTAA